MRIIVVEVKNLLEDCEKIQKAIDEVADKGGVVVLKPAGKYDTLEWYGRLKEIERKFGDC